jgi:hypothetical protein
MCRYAWLVEVSLGGSVSSWRMRNLRQNPMVLHPDSPLVFEVISFDDVVGTSFEPMDFRSLVDLIRLASYPDWFLFDAKSTMWTDDVYPVPPAAIATELGIEPIAAIGGDLVLNGNDLSRLLMEIQTYNLRAYDIENSDADQTDNWVAAASSGFRQDLPVIPTMDGVSVFVSEHEELWMYVETSQVALVMDIFRLLLATMIEVALHLASTATLKEVPLPDVEFARQLLGGKDVFLADRKNSTWHGSTVTVPYTNMTFTQAVAFGVKPFPGAIPNDLAHFEAVGHVEYDLKEQCWQNTPARP